MEQIMAILAPNGKLYKTSEEAEQAMLDEQREKERAAIREQKKKDVNLITVWLANTRAAKDNELLNYRHPYNGPTVDELYEVGFHTLLNNVEDAKHGRA